MQGNAMQGNAMQGTAMQGNTMQGSTMQGNAMQGSTIPMQGNTLQANTMTANAMQMQAAMPSTSMPSSSMQGGSMQANPMQASPIQGMQIPNAKAYGQAYATSQGLDQQQMMDYSEQPPLPGYPTGPLDQFKDYSPNWDLRDYGNSMIDQSLGGGQGTYGHNQVNMVDRSPTLSRAMSMLTTSVAQAGNAPVADQMVNSNTNSGYSLEHSLGLDQLTAALLKDALH
jgi:hypothetical protein